ENRISKTALGFGADVKGKNDRNLHDIFTHLHPEDLIKYGMIPEFIGRLPIQVNLEDLTLEDLKRIMTEPKNSIIKQYQESLRIDGVELVFEDDAITAVAEQAIQRRTGARGLRSIVETMMLDIMFDIPSMEGAKRVIVTREVVEGARKPSVELLAKSA
ncbi:MAG: ATP-dependent Clp protease ATP-binding subunit ClpX, partial [Treponema sp.]|nr:ATP-dependent Clp protease ATP-binding subunit ClpX [Treponema sp.]